MFIEQTDEQKYLGFMISSKGNNMANINQMKKKSHGIIRTIFTKLQSMNLSGTILNVHIVEKYFGPK